jgi:2-phospho-L-lactate guanylyltransferase
MVQRSADVAGVVIPIRSFAHAKARLASALSDDARATLARAMAERVVEAAGTRPIIVVTSAPDVGAWCADRSIATVDDPGTLDTAADAGRTWARNEGLVRVAIVHADLPFATTLDDVANDGDTPVAVVVPDHRDDGTPVLVLPVDASFTFMYGPGSAARHIHEAARCGLDVRVVRDDSLAFDVDIEADLRALESRRP